MDYDAQREDTGVRIPHDLTSPCPTAACEAVR